MADHVLHLLQAALGVLLAFLAVHLWSFYRRLSTAVLGITALLLYSLGTVRLLSFYHLIDDSTPRFVPVSLQDLLLLLVILCFILDLVIFIREERGRERRPK